MEAPQILLAKVISCDRWNIRVIELAAFKHLHGHCDVPDVETRTEFVSLAFSAGLADFSHPGPLGSTTKRMLREGRVERRTCPNPQCDWISF